MANKSDLLSEIRVASPCSASWGDMQGDERVRFCAQCKLNVYNLASMSRAEAEALLAPRTKVCVQFYKRPDGTVLTQDCPVGLAALKRRVVLAGSAMAAALTLA